MAKSFQEKKFKISKAQSSKQNQLASKLSLFNLKIQKKDASRLLQVTTRQVEAIQVHRMIVRTDWAAIIRIVQLLQLIYTSVKNYSKKRDLRHKQEAMKYFLRYRLKRHMKKVQLQGPGTADTFRAFCGLAVAAANLREKAEKRATAQLKPFFSGLHRMMDLKFRCLQYSLTSRFL